MAMRFHLSGNSPPKAPERLFILPVALRYWRIGGIRSGHHCEPSLFHITHHTHVSTATVVHREPIHYRTTIGGARNSKAIKQ